MGRRGLVSSIGATLGALAAVAAAAFTAASSPGCTAFDGVTFTPDAQGPKKETGADAPPPEEVVGYLSAANAARVCASVFKCPQLAPSVLYALAVPLDRLNYSMCMDWLAGPIPTTRVGRAVQAQTLECVARAVTCAEAGACLSQEIIAADDPRCADAGTDASDRCEPDGLGVIRCQFLDVLHCQTIKYGPGSKCLAGSPGRFWCGVDRNCPAQDSCVGSLLDYCGTSGVHASINCQSAGYTCGLDKDSGANDCLTGDRLRPCTGAGASCAGDVVSVCDGYNLSEFDCAAQGATCAKNGANARCVRDTDTCTPLDSNLHVCDGSAISLCFGGQRVRFDCASIEKRCEPGKGSQSGHCE
jgi:hypothetical protein